ncbi:hypothetical protein ACSFA3_01240 [Variovorax sp. RHLX14]|uniref:hypothetical protein n=1 Tax=Variovorax sp. RHLX14 TaxID=1259731 RepID=UPI003F464300
MSSAPNINSAHASASIGKSANLRDSSAMPKKEAPSFSRSISNDSALQSLLQPGSANAVSHNYSALERIAVSDLIRVVSEVRNGQMMKAKDHLASMSKSAFNELCNNRNVHPFLLGELSTSMDISKDPKKVLPAVFEALKFGGGSNLSSRLRPANKAEA